MAAFSVNSLGLFCINTWIWKRQDVQTQNITAASAEKSILYYILHVLSLSLKEQKIVKLRVAQLLHLSIHMYKFFLYEWLLAGWSQWAKKTKKTQSNFKCECMAFHMGKLIWFCLLSSITLPKYQGPEIEFFKANVCYVGI